MATSGGSMGNWTRSSHRLSCHMTILVGVVGSRRAHDRILQRRQSTGLSILRSLRCFLSAFPDGRRKDSNRSKQRKRRAWPGPRRRKRVNSTWDQRVYRLYIELHRLFERRIRIGIRSEDSRKPGSFHRLRHRSNSRERASVGRGHGHGSCLEQRSDSRTRLVPGPQSSGAPCAACQYHISNPFVAVAQARISPLSPVSSAPV